MFRFTIRDVLWLTVVAALGVGWWIDHSSLAEPAAKYRSLTPSQLDAAEAVNHREIFDLLRDTKVTR
jgi:hypothetical protein